MAINKIDGSGETIAQQVNEHTTEQPDSASNQPVAADLTLPSSQTTSPTATTVRRGSMKGEFLRDQLEARLSTGKRTDVGGQEKSTRASWGNITPSARTIRSDNIAASNSLRRSARVDAVAANTTLSTPLKRTVTFVYDTGGRTSLTNLQLKGSWNKTTGAFDSLWGEGDAIPMRDIGEGKWMASVELLDDGQPHNWEWGVIADGPAGKGQWALMGEGNLKFNLTENTKQITYTPTTFHQMGAHKIGKTDISFKFWAPNAQHVNVKVFDEFGRTKLIPMKRDIEGNWTVKVRGGWKSMAGKAYSYQLIDSEGKTVERSDPYARVMQGEQRGIGRTYINLKTGQETNKFYMDPDVYQQFKPQIEGPDPALAEAARQRARELSLVELTRFEVEEHPDAEAAYMIFKDETGRQLTRQELINRLGRVDSALIDRLRGGKYNDLWSNNVDEQGRIKLVNAGGTWSTLVNNLEKLTGLRYEFQVYRRDTEGDLRLLGDRNNDGTLSVSERKSSSVNDRWSDLITSQSGRSFRTAVIADTKYNWQHDNVPREKDRNKWVVYQLHVGSFFGNTSNTNRSTFEDLMQKLDHFKSLGVNTLELLPVNEVEGERDWGYMGANSFAIENSYGFVDEQGRWVNGAEALKRFIDMAHSKGLNVINDVVYNHIGGDHNMMWNLDGKENPYFNWSKDPNKFEKRDTAWGAMPAYNNPKVRQFFVDHAVAQIDEFRFDGLRFDFTEPIKGTGGKDGWEMLREINRQLHFYRPDVFTVAEQFDYDPAITRPVLSDGTGGGFDAQWYTEFQHRLVRDNSNPGVIQQAAQGQHTNMDLFMNMLINPRGLDTWTKAYTVISNHDEVGNAQRTIDTADGDSTTKIPPQWARNAARFAAGIGLAAPGIPMFFQGDESMAQNTFNWGVPSTWDIGWEWESLGRNWDWNGITFNDDQRRLYNRLFEMSPAEREKDAGYRSLSIADRQVFSDLALLNQIEREQAMLNITRRQMFQFYQDALALRASSPAFEADAQVTRVYTHNDNSVMAFTRKDGNAEFLIIASLNRNNLSGYLMDLPAGQWKEVLNSDAARYGGSNFGNFGATINGGPSQVNIPAGGYVVLKKVG
ncbi:MAG: alpha-amylase family glycosyl hydrolase [Acidobacteriota bacterium]